MEKILALSFVLCFAASAAVGVFGQDTKGFISIDSGNTNGFVDSVTKLAYTSDDQYIETGINANVASNYKSNVPLRTLASLRSFPNGVRNCYHLKPVVRNSTYLIRAAFFHGNYDSHFSAQSKQPLLFDLYIGASKWRTLNITDASLYFTHEATIVALAEVLYVCLVNTGEGTPFISLLELRPMSSPFYPYVDDTQFADLQGRADLGGSSITRYPDDKYDRIWYPVMLDIWANISTINEVNTDHINSNSELPTAVLQTAIISSPSAPSSPNLEFSWTQQDGIISPIAVNYYFAELKQLSNRSRREFNIYYNGRQLIEHVNPEYLKSLIVYTPQPLKIPSNLKKYGFALNITSNSTEPALANAVEIFSVLPVDTKMTNAADSDAIFAIKAEYKVNKGWTGDPCAPAGFPWVGVGCDYVGNSSKIISLNLSSSGLTGSISSSFSKLQNIQILDLSNNGLKGTIPDFLATMTSLKLLNLTGNSFNCDIPDTLQKRSDSGVLLLVNDNKCAVRKSRKAIGPVIGLISAAVVLVLLSVLLYMGLQGRPQVSGQGQNPDPIMPKMQPKTQIFTERELKKITKNFSKKIGQGGFGSVFSGTLKDGTSVAVKRLSQSSEDAHKQFLTEAQNLATLYHKNLLSLIGYCEEERCLALIYEYMPQGTLEDHITGTGEILGWKERLRIALEAAQGLEYMHKASKLPIVHRDVKCSNILLGDNLEAKVADLGLARAFRNNDQGTVATVCGTIGYIDPEFFKTSNLTTKSDVYSFGIVLLQIITGLPPVIQENCHLMQHVTQKLQREDITSVIDGRFQGDYNINSVWKVFNLAMRCTKKESSHRPIISDVVTELKDSLDLETHRVKGQNNHRENTSIHGRMHSDTFSIGDGLSISGDSMSQHNMHSESFRVGYRSNGEDDYEVMLGPSLR